MQTLILSAGTRAYFFLAVTFLAILTGCSSGSSDPVTVDGDVAIAYVKRPTSTLGNPTDAIMFTAGGDLYLREKSSPSAAEINITGSQTNGTGDVSDPEVSYDGTKLLFSMRRAADPGWRIWEYDIGPKTLRGPIACTASGTTPDGDDVDPAYLPDGRIVFVSNRQEKSRQLMTQQGMTPFAYLDEYERERVTALHVMNADGTNCRQISYNQSHDRNPTVLQTGEIMYSRWDHVGGRNQFSIFFTNPDGTNLFVLYGAHSPGNSYLHPRELPSGQVISTLMPLSRTREGGSLEIIDYKNYSANNTAGTTTPPANQLGVTSGQFQATRLLFGNPVDDHVAMRGRVEPLPQVTVLDRVAAGRLPATAYPVLHPLGDALADVLRVGMEDDRARLGQGFQRHDRAHQLHAVVGGGWVAAGNLALAAIAAQQCAPATGPGIAEAGAIGVDVHGLAGIGRHRSIIAGDVRERDIRPACQRRFRSGRGGIAA